MIPPSVSTAPFVDRLNQARDVHDLSIQILQCVKDSVPLNAALIVMGHPARVVRPDGFPAERMKELQTRLEDHPEHFRDLVDRDYQAHQTLSFPDGSVVLLLPFRHAEVLEFVLCLYASERDSHELPEKMKSVFPLCDLASQAMARVRLSETVPGGEYFPPPLKSPDLSVNPTSVLSSRLMGNIAHDLRSPITVIRGYLKMLLNGRIGVITGEQKECLEGAMKSVNQLANLASNIGGVSGIMQQLHPEVLNLHDLWRMASQSIGPQALAKALILKEEVPATPSMICGDRRLLCDVIEKLLVRTIAFADRGTELLTELSTRKNGDVILKFMFSCSAIPLEVEEVVSELQSIVFLHGGQLTLKTKIDERPSFTLLLPGYDA